MRELPKGSMVAGHRVEELAGRGGMGVVYRATQLDLGRPVALKLIAHQIADDAGFRERFQRESQLAASIDHPNVIPVYQAGEINGSLFITMRYVDGRDLHELLDEEGRLAPERAVHIVTRVAAALDAAHQRGLVHRDVKPANILIARDGSEEHVYLTDFGLTKDTHAEGGLTGTGQFVGTIDYASPEQIQGRAPDARADVYSLGCVLFHAVTGHRPYERDSDVAKLFAHLHDPPPSVLELLPDAPSLFDDVIRRALAKDPAERYPSAGDLARAAAAALAAAAPAEPERSVATGPAATAMPNVQEVTRVRDVPTTRAAPAAPPDQPPAATRPGRGRLRLVAIGAGALAAVAAVAVIALLALGGDDEEPVTAGAGASPAATEDPAEPTDWRPLRAMPTARQQMPAAVLGGTVWVVGGLTSDAATATVEGYESAIDSWRTAPPLPLPLHHAMAVAYEDELVVLGGWTPDGANLTATTSDRVFALRGAEWVELPRMRRPRAAGAAVVADGRIVVVGGQADGELVAQTDVFDGERWTDGAPIPTQRDHLAAAADGRFAYAVGGRALSADQNTDAFERYDPRTDRWEELPGMPTPRGGLSAAIIEGRLVAAGGEEPTRVLATVEAYDLGTGEWAVLDDMPTPRHGVAAAAVGGSLVVIGGATVAGHAGSSETAQALGFAE